MEFLITGNFIIDLFTGNQSELQLLLQTLKGQYREDYLFSSTFSFLCQFISLFVGFYFMLSTKMTGKGSFITNKLNSFSPALYQLLAVFVFVLSFYSFYFKLP